MAALRCLFPVLSAAFLSAIFVLSALSGFFASTSSSSVAASSSSKSLIFSSSAAASPSPSFAYFISGLRGDGPRLIRLLLAVYHPRNRYLLHLAADASDRERRDLARAVQSWVPASRAFGNVDVLGKPNAATNMGSSVLASVLHAAAVMLRLDGGWDWFVTLSAADYPMVSQDDLFHAFSSAPREINFIDHISDIGWKDYHRVQPIVVDPGIYLARRAQIFHATERRPTPESFKFFTGSPWVILSRPFIEFCILGWDNLPRTLLLYFANALIPEESYFHSVACNSQNFQNTTLNSDLRYMVWDNPPQMEPHFLNVSDYDKMVHTSAPFARQFHMDDPVLDKIDREILRRGYNQVVPGGWCTGDGRPWFDPCSKWGDPIW
ncbi:hypothetical protein QJS10_CPB14g00303 [Acorus calamus]|uniref:Uncharacterized protein n=1 Tax=Acorus calamus TaxID=4465 RepID=A0AAV9DC43_ACOCL|nr:hypothetical protein QJS10_CPB14g00303 [Acorus calamus]